MIDINTMTGQPVRIVKATLNVELTFRVGGDDDADRVDAVKMALDDRYDETVNQSFWRDAISGLSAASVAAEDPAATEFADGSADERRKHEKHD